MRIINPKCILWLLAYIKCSMEVIILLCERKDFYKSNLHSPPEILEDNIAIILHPKIFDFFSLSV
jgi:hypothetical protein